MYSTRRYRRTVRVPTTYGIARGAVLAYFYEKFPISILIRYSKFQKYKYARLLVRRTSYLLLV